MGMHAHECPGIQQGLATNLASTPKNIYLKVVACLRTKHVATHAVATQLRQEKQQRKLHRDEKITQRKLHLDEEKQQ